MKNRDNLYCSVRKNPAREAEKGVERTSVILMNMKKILISITIVLAIVVGGFFWLNSYIYNEKQAGEEFTQEQKQTMAYVHIKENISELSPQPEVLGGTFYVTNIEFTGDNIGTVEYEDGHIALVADFEYSVSENEEVTVRLMNVREAQQ